MKVNFYCPVGFEPWDYRNLAIGIGGSETCVCEMSWRLVKRGYDVTVYGNIGEGCEPEWRGVKWRELEECDPSEEAIWIIHRSPAATKAPWNGQVWLMCQDLNYAGWEIADVDRITTVIALCKPHARYLAKQYPEIADKIKVSSNGVRVDLFEKLKAEGIERNPKKLIWASSPDRGLAQALLPAWKKIRQRVPDAELHIYYGFNNIEKMVDGNPDQWGWMRKIMDDCLRYFEEYKDQGVIWHGRVGQEELYRAWLSSAIWPYFSSFEETSCIVSMEAQVGGAIPITRPWWAVGENVKHGVMVNGDPYNDRLAIARLIDETCVMLQNEDYQNAIRPTMMEEASIRCDWERVVDQWQQWIHGWPMTAVCQFAFQHQHIIPPAINIGANCDSSNIKSRGALNVDCREIDPGTGWKNNIDMIADATCIPLPDKSFKTAILGDILEHCKTQDIAREMFNEAKRLADRVIITCPEDYRGQEIQHANGGHFGDMPEDYSEKTNSFHAYPVTREWLEQVAGKPSIYQPIRYTHMNGHGFVIDFDEEGNSEC